MLFMAYSTVNSLHAGTFFSKLYLAAVYLLFFFKINFSNSNRNGILMLNSRVPDQARHFVGPDLRPNCLE